MTSFGHLAGLAFVLLLATVPARAQERPAAVWDRPFAVAARTDLLPIPLNDALATFEVAPIRSASLEIGAGASAFQRPLFLTALHAQLPLGRWAPGLEAGLQNGPFRWSPGTQAHGGWSVSSNELAYAYEERHGMAVFLRVGATLGFRSTGGFHLRFQAGALSLLNRAQAYCLGNDGSFPGCHLAGIPAALPYLGASVGYAFGPPLR